VPDYCELEVDRRTLPGESLDSVRAEFQALVDRVAETHPQFSFEIDGPTICIGALDVPESNPGVSAVLAAAQRVTGQPARAEAFFGGTDAPNFGFPMVIYGAGSIAQAHTLDEYVDIDDWLTATRTYLSTLLAFSATQAG
jgi:acetylornithine deacetylase